MSIIEKVFHYEENEITVIKCRDDIWFKAKQVATLLGYLDPGRSIRQNVNPEDLYLYIPIILYNCSHFWTSTKFLL